MKRLITILGLVALLPKGFVVTVTLFAIALSASTQNKKPNIVVIMGDDIRWYNTSIYNRGDMGYQTPNIDRIGQEGALFLGAPRSSRDSHRYGPD
jgi:hypothetical protein